MKLSLQQLPIGTRDGSLLKDSKSVNVLNGQKRPGLSPVVALAAGAGQGMVESPTLGALAVRGNSFYKVSTGALVAAIPSGVGPYEFTAPLQTGLIAFKDGANIWTLLGSVVTLVATGFTLPILPGIVYLDGSYYVMLSDGTIRGSDLNNPTSWPVLNSIVLNADLGRPVAITRHQNYLMGLAEDFSVMYYDAGNPPPGSPLQLAQTTYSDVGCAVAGSIAELNENSFFMGKSLTRGRSIYIVDGLKRFKISTENVDKILDKSTLASVSSWTIKTYGFDLYVLTLRDLGVTLVFDLAAKNWDVWSSSTTVNPDPVVANSYDQSYFSSNVYLSGDGMDLLQHDSNGKIYQLSNTVYQDDGLPIDVQFVTTVLEGEDSSLTRIGAAEVVGDKIASTAYVRYSDDDYQTYSTYQTVNLGESRSQVVRQGATRRRAYQIRHTDNTDLHLRSLLLDVIPKG